MHFPTTLTSALLLAGSSLVQGQYNYGPGSDDSNGYGSGDMKSSVSPAVAVPLTTATTTANEPASSDSAGTKVHVVMVSNPNGDLTFSPADIKAAQGDVVQFQFYPKVSPITWTRELY